MGVISASRAQWSKRGGKGKRRASGGGGVKKKKKRILGRGNGPRRRADCLSVCPPAVPRLPGPRRSQKFTQNGGAARTGWEAEAGGRARWEGIWEVEAASRGGEDTGHSLEGRRKEPNGVSEAEGRREHPRVAERETGGGGKSRSLRGGGAKKKVGGAPRAGNSRSRSGAKTTRNCGDPERSEGSVGVGGRRRKQPKEAARG